MSTLSNRLAKEKAEAEKKKTVKKKTTKKVDESQNSNICLSYRRFSFRYT